MDYNQNVLPKIWNFAWKKALTQPSCAGIRLDLHKQLPWYAQQSETYELLLYGRAVCVTFIFGLSTRYQGMNMWISDFQATIVQIQKEMPNQGLVVSSVSRR